MSAENQSQSVLLWVILFAVIFLVVNAFAMLVFWFSHAITSNNRASTLDFSDFDTNIVTRRTEGDRSDKPAKRRQFLIQEDLEDEIFIRPSGLSYTRQSSVSSLSSSLSDLGFLSDSDEELTTVMAGQALSGHTESLVMHRTVSLQKTPQLQPQLDPSSLALLQKLEEKESDDFNRLLVDLKSHRTDATDRFSLFSIEDLVLPTAILKEFQRYHCMVPIRLFEPSFLRPPPPAPRRSPLATSVLRRVTEFQPESGTFSIQ